MSAPPSFSSSSFSYVFTYDVFLSFRGTDTRHSFTGNLYKALRNKGVRTFFDDVELRKGEEITPTLVKAIEESRIAIPVFSKNYASSSFCLAELVKIMECVKEKGRLVLPIFYDVDPCDVRHQRVSYGEALAKHEERFKDDKEKVQKWREALHQVANLAGEDFKLGNEYEYVFIDKIVKEISNKISRVPLHVADYPIRLESRMLEVNSLLNDGSNGGVHVVGICGVGGIGKTTLSRAIYNLIADQFEGLCFLENVRENSIKHGLAHLQEMLLSKILGEKDIKLASVSEGISIIKHSFQSKKVLLVLDDVDKLEQLQAIVGRPNWFGFGSRVIITTRDKHLLATHGVERKYEVEVLNNKEALELLSWNAFKYEKIDPSYMDILNKVVSYASGLPLALVVIGSNLFGRSVEEWISALDEYKKIPNKDIQKILKVSFDALEEYQQKFFLDIACCFKGYQLTEVENILHAHYGVSPKFGIHALVEGSLIKINEHGFVTLHDSIQDMGREIVRQESPQKPGERSRLWLLEDIMQVLQENTGTSEIEIINLEAPIFEAVEWDGEAFKKMENLKTLIIRNGNFFKGPKHLPNSLRVLEWRGYPSHFLPSDFHPKRLAILKLPNNCLPSLQLIKLLKKFVNLRVLNFSENKWITQIPDASSAPNLEKLYFANCENLTKIDESVGFLGELRILDVHGCRKLRSFPPLMLPSLEELYLLDCSSLESFPEILGKMENLTQLSLMDTSIKELPYSICNLTRLQRLQLIHRGSILLPSSIFMLLELDALCFDGCECLLLPNQDEGVEQVSRMVSSNATYLDFDGGHVSDEFLRLFLPRFPRVQVLILSSTNFTILPACIKDCRFLRFLYVNYCHYLKEIRGIPPNIEGLYAINCTSMSCSSRRLLLNKKLHEEGGDMTFVLPATRIPRWFEHQGSGQSISIWFRNKYPAISLCVLLKEKLVNECELWPGMKVIINDSHEFQLYQENFNRYRPYHVYIFDIEQVKFEADVDEMLLKNEWNQAVISLINRNIHEPRELKDLARTEIGLHIIKERSSMDDIRFTNPLLQKDEHRSMDVGDSNIQHMQRQQTNLASLEPHVGQGRELLLCLPPPALNDNLNWESNPKLISSTTTTTVQDAEVHLAILEHPEKAPGESSQAADFAKTQNTEAQSPNLSSGKISGQEELHLNAMLATTIDESVRNQLEPSQDDLDMEAFYASLDSDIYVSTSEDAKEALKIVQDFITKDPSFLLDREQCSIMKTSLDYLSNFSANDDGLSGEMRALISEASRVFTHHSRDYIEASTKIESTASELLKADELEADLEDNKNQFKEVVAFEKELLQKLVYLEESKGELEKQINAIIANISTSQSEQSMTRKRKRDIFEEGKKLKTQTGEFRKKVPHLQHEQDLAKETQTKIKAEWSELGEKFKKIVGG